MPKPAMEVRTGWVSTLSRVALAALIFEALSGLVITFAAFNAAVQWTVLVHTLVGLAVMIPLTWYVLAHWLDYKSYNMSDSRAAGLRGRCGAAGLRGVGAGRHLAGRLRDPDVAVVAQHPSLFHLRDFGGGPGARRSGLHPCRQDTQVDPAGRTDGADRRRLGGGSRGDRRARGRLRWRILRERVSGGLQLPLR